MLPVGRYRVRAPGIDDQRAIDPRLFLHPRMTVVPVGPGLLDGKVILEGLARADPRKRHPGDAIHIRWQQDPVPVDRGVLGQAVGHPQGGHVPFAESEEWARHGAVDGHRLTRATSEWERGPINGEIDGALMDPVTGPEPGLGPRESRYQPVESSQRPEAERPRLEEFAAEHLGVWSLGPRHPGVPVCRHKGSYWPRAFNTADQGLRFLR